MRSRRLGRTVLVVGAGLSALLVPLLVPTTASAATATLGAEADAYVSSSAKSRSFNYGSETALRTSSTKRSYLRFVIPSGTTPVTSAVLRIYATPSSSSSSSGYTVSATTSSWGETTITGANAPVVGASAGTSGPVTAGTWSTVDITRLVTADGPVSVVMTANSGTSMTYGSREAGAATAPQLVLTTAVASPSPSPSPSAASPSPSPTASSPSPSPSLTQSPSASPTGSSPSPSAAPPASSYAGTVRADGPIGYWRLGDSGSSVADASGAGRTGTYSGGVTHPAGTVGDADAAASFDGSTGKAAIPDDAAVRLNGAFTIEFWARLDTFVNNYPGLLVKGLASGPDGYLIWYSSAGQLNFKRNNISAASPAGALTTAWRHFALTYDATTLRWYVDGSLSASSARSYPANNGTAPLELGRGDQYGKESLDEVALYDRALTAAQVAAHKAAAAPAASPSPSPSPSASPSVSPSPTPSPSPSPTPTFIGPVAPTVTIAAAGDIACDPTDVNYNNGLGTASFCRQKATAALLEGRGYDAILPLGDLQYADGTLSKFQTSYDSSWGSTKPLQRPAVGNHEYLDPNAAGYYTYNGATAGDPAKGYYSYNLGSWHIVALNSECAYVGGCGPGSPQETWLRADLAANPASCTLAYWHKPNFTSTTATAAPVYQAFWDALQAAGAEVVLGGHSHNYERFAPQTANANPDPNGIRQFVVGTGGKNLVGFDAAPLPNSEVRNSDTFGVLEMTLKPGSYDWKFVPEAGKTFTDAGTTNCH